MSTLDWIPPTLTRKRTLRSALRGFGYSVHDPWPLALLTTAVLEEHTKAAISNLVFANIRLLHPFSLRGVTTVEKGLIPTIQTIETEKVLEAKRLNELEKQNMVAFQMQSSLRGTHARGRSLLCHSPFQEVPVVARRAACRMGVQKKNSSY
ncbi:uncharacterized protein C4orf36 homolog [Ambystoma mexicanum]|uniref:uncharacterized protein C4orf36 homolog n=1 Tax=Ambystoma mexicanum TaxID=8296 RepID=UPI0037E7F4BF